MQQQEIVFTVEEIVKYIGIGAGLIIAAVGIYNLVIYTFKAMTKDIESLQSRVSAIEETHQNVTSSLIEISTTQNSFMARAEEQWERQNTDMKRIIDNQSEFNKLVADRFQKTDDRFQKFDDNILQFYKDNGRLINKG